MQIKTTIRHHVTPMRMTIIKNSINKCWKGYKEKGNTCTLFMGIQISAVTRENSMELPHKMKSRITT